MGFADYLLGLDQKTSAGAVELLAIQTALPGESAMIAPK
jgi:hypothetical protein